MARNEDDLWAAHEAELTAFADRRVSKLLRRLEEARRAIQAEIADAPDFAPRRLLQLAKEIDAIGADLRRGIADIGPSAEKSAKLAQAHLQEAIPAVTGVEVALSLEILNTTTLERFANIELEHVSKLTAAEIEQVKAQLFTEVGVKGQNPAQVAKRLAGTDSRWAKRYGHLENIFRTEVSTVYNAQTLEGIQAANDAYGLTMRKRIVETIDSVRNHPISQVLNNQVQEVGEPFRVKVAAVAARAKALKRPGLGGILWPRVGDEFVGQRLPAHYHERGRLVPTQRPATPNSGS